MKKSRGSIANSFIAQKNSIKTLDSTQKVDSKYKFLKVVLSLYPSSILLSWSEEKLGSGSVSFYLENSTLNFDSEEMSNEFVEALIKKAVELYKNDSLEIRTKENLLSDFLVTIIHQIKNLS